ncbi:hypothetical protein AYO39_03465 [Actinobacteria bacterium SCGC AG-212-D09]|nr:hypothetical protein AYO39_03465 [Actinobacteria bacterium SCGC AG-212-D09]
MPESANPREDFYLSAGKMTSYVSVESETCVFLVRAEDQNVGRLLFVKQGRGEMRTLERAVKLISAAGRGKKRGRQFIDIGANIGTTTIPALRLHGFESAICFEPEPQNLLTLRLNLLLNGVEQRARAIRAAVSNESGEAQLVVDLKRSGEHWIATDPKMLSERGKGSEPISVPTVTIDQLVADGTIDLDQVGLLWMDAQAHEGHILEGAQRLLKRGIPVVFEWDPKALDRVAHERQVEEIAASQYTHFVDLRPSINGEGALFELREGRALGDYSSSFGEPGLRGFTDILLLRLSPSAAKRLNVSKLLGPSEPEPKAAPEQKKTGTPARDKPETTEPTKKPAPTRRESKPGPKEVARRRAAKREATSKNGTDGQRPAPAETNGSDEQLAALREAKKALTAAPNAAPAADGSSDPAERLRIRKRSPEADAVRKAKQALQSESPTETRRSGGKGSENHAPDRGNPPRGARSSSAGAKRPRRP